LNPDLDILIKEDWLNIYDMMGAEKVEKFDQAQYFQNYQEEMFKKYPQFKGMFGK
jgi:hypothetical protein